MPQVIDYAVVTETMRAAGLVSLYHNSGAFGFPPDTPGVRHVGWVGPPDPTIRPAALPQVRHVPPPFEFNLANLAAVIWNEHLPGPAWVLPRSHWAYELSMGSHAWLPNVLRDIGVNPDSLSDRNEGSAVQFDPAEREPLIKLVSNLLTHLLGSDFALAFPGRRTVCTVHHHKQLWWTSESDEVMDALDRLVPPGAG